MLNNDTVVVLSKDQIKKINITYAEKDYYKNIAAVLDSTVKVIDSLSQEKSKLIGGSGLEKVYLKNKIAKIENDNLILISYNKKLKADRLKFAGIGLVGGVLVGILIAK